jgi:hypothetical protein
MRGALSHSEQIESVARGLCGAAPRRFGARIKWLPTINKVPASTGETEDDCFDFKIDAVAEAKRLRDHANNLRAQANGEAP